MEDSRDAGSSTHLRMKYDPTINLGHILTSLVICGSVLGVYVNIVRTTDRLDMELMQLKASVEMQRQQMAEERKEAKEKSTADRVFQEQVLKSIAEIREKMVSIETRVSVSFPDARSNKR